MLKQAKSKLALAALMVLSPILTFAQNGVTGLNTATSSLKTYVDPVTNIALVIGGIVGIVGAIRVYSKWNSGDQDIRLTDPGADFSKEEVRNFYANLYPVLTTAKIRGPEIKDDEVVYHFETSMGTKG